MLKRRTAGARRRHASQLVTRSEKFWAPRCRHTAAPQHHRAAAQQRERCCSPPVGAHFGAHSIRYLEGKPAGRGLAAWQQSSVNQACKLQTQFSGTQAEKPKTTGCTRSAATECDLAPAALLDAAAVLVGSVVGLTLQELVDQVACRGDG